MPWWDPTFKPESRTSIKHSQKSLPWQRAPAERARRDAELFAEFITPASDNDGYGVKPGPFGTRRTGGSELAMYREKHPAVFESISAALGRHWVRSMKLEEKRLEKERRKKR